MALPFEILARTHLAKADEYWLADRLREARAAIDRALNAGMTPGSVYDLQRMIDAELAARLRGSRRRIEEHLEMELPRALPAELVARMDQASVKAMRAIERRLQTRWSKPVLITVFASADASLFMHARYGYYAERTDRHKVCLPAAIVRSGRELYRALLHEIAHAATAETAGPDKPRWFDEGVAVWAEGPPDPRDLDEIRALAAQSRLPALSEIAHVLNSSETELGSAVAQTAYVVAGLFVRFLARRAGSEAPAAILRRLRLGEALPKAVRRVAGAELSALERDWRTALGAGSPRS